MNEEEEEMSEVKEEEKELSEAKGLFDIFDEFKDDEDTKFFQFMRRGQSWGATAKKPARVSIQMPIDICNTENRNLGEVENYFGIVMFIPKGKVKKFINEE